MASCTAAKHSLSAALRLPSGQPVNELPGLLVDARVEGLAGGACHQSGRPCRGAEFLPSQGRGSVGRTIGERRQARPARWPTSLFNCVSIALYYSPLYINCKFARATRCSANSLECLQADSYLIFTFLAHVQHVHVHVHVHALRHTPDEATCACACACACCACTCTCACACACTAAHA